MGQIPEVDVKGSREDEVNKRQKKKLFNRKCGYSITGCQREVFVFLVQVFTGIGMTEKKWEKAEKILNTFITSKAYDRNTRNVENFNQIMKRRRYEKSWSELTEAEINRNKRNTCEKCLYFSRDGSTTTAGSRHCEYLLITGHRRGCSPLECKKKGIFKARPTGRRRINRAFTTS